MIDWHWQKFDGLTADELFDIFELRQQVFIIEQCCAYPDIDELDKVAWHLCGHHDDGSLVAYLRVMPPSKKMHFVSIGRVVTAQSIRGQGIGKQVFSEGIQFSQKHYPNSSMKISAQVHLQKFYSEFDFDKVSEPYDEDGIMHIDMHRHE